MIATNWKWMQCIFGFKLVTTTRYPVPLQFMQAHVSVYAKNRTFKPGRGNMDESCGFK